MNNDSGFTPKELRKLRSMKNPYGIQKFLDDMPYHLEDTAWSPRKVLAEESSHCLEGAIFGAAALRANGYPPLLLDFEAEHDTDHVIAVFQEAGCWGAVAKSNYTGCRWREPIYRNLRELALSYFNAYFNFFLITIVSFSLATNSHGGCLFLHSACQLIPIFYSALVHFSIFH